MRLLSGNAASHSFARSPQADIPRSSFDRSHTHKTTFDAGYLVPIFVDEVLPGDTFNLQMTAFARLATPIFPVMDNLTIESFFFFIPIRLVWSNWERFNGAQDNPTDSTDYVIPTVTSPAVTGYATGSLFDYFGLPTLVPGVTTNVLPLRCFNLTYNDWFRDENIQDSVPVPTGDGPDDPTIYQMAKRGKRYDYFTSCLPFPQKGPSVELPLGSTAPVVPATPGSSGPGFVGTTDISFTGLHSTNASAATSFTNVRGATENMLWANTTGLVTDLAAATAATVNQLRQAFQIQKMYERDARGGTRYVEILLSHFQVQSPDFRLQRPEFLGGGSSPVNIHPVAQTAPPTSTDDTPQGNLAAFGTTSLINHGFTHSFVEHGYIIGLVSVRADYTYQQGCERMWFRSTRFDFYWPVFSHLGEQAVLNREIYTQGSANPAQDLAVFGYQEAWADYRYKPSRISGLFRSNASGTLDAWHLSQDFGALPTLAPTFIVENPPMTRIKAVTDQPDFIFDSFIRLRSARPMPVYSVPGLIDHF